MRTTRVIPFMLIAVVILDASRPGVGHAADGSLPPRTNAVINTNRIVASQAGYKFMLLLPTNYTNGVRRYPLIIFLHGACADENLRKFKHFGPMKFGLQHPDFPFLVVSPASARGWSLGMLDVMLNQLQRGYRIDPDRIYLTGYSNGGHATWNWAMAAPTRFAAIAPVAGASDPDKAARLLRHLPVWVFHGVRDNVVPFAYGQAMADALTSAGGKVKTTFYPARGHDTWDVAYAEAGLYDWFLQHRRPGARPATR